MNRQINNQEQNIDDLLKLVDKLLPLAKLTDEQKERIRKDVEALADDLKSLIPEVGAMMGLSFLTDHGVEGYQILLGRTRPPGRLETAGLAPARRRQPDPGHRRAAKGQRQGLRSGGQMGQDGLRLLQGVRPADDPGSDREKAKKFLAAALPLVERMDKANREMLIPALADGQSALVIDGKLTSKHFIERCRPPRSRCRWSSRRWSSASATPSC